VRGRLRIDDRDFADDEGLAVAVGSSYFDARGVGLLSGRGFSDGDAAAGAAVAVVDEKFARRAWPDRSPLGLSVGVGDEPLRTVVGVVRHQRWNLSEETPGLVYVPRPAPTSRTGMLIWAPGLREDDVAGRLAAPLAALAPHYGLRVRTETFDRRFADQLTEVRMQRPVVIVLGLFAFVLSGVGLFGLVTWVVEQRTRDFGIRLALGARATDIWADVVRQSVVPAVSGMAIGAGIAWTLEGVVEATMYGWKSSGLLAMALVSVALLTVAILAATGPARRVLRIDPTMALRAE
jgi:ABC-type antimicrobial peptide transport system permease subunit